LIWVDPEYKHDPVIEYLPSLSVFTRKELGDIQLLITFISLGPDADNEETESPCLVSFEDVLLHETKTIAKKPIAVKVVTFFIKDGVLLL
jgi:hypothetical protein